MSMRENITFGSPYDPVWYGQVIESCALAADLTQLPNNDETPVGESGLGLSGGQKARLSLARACYASREQKKHVYLLDDPLSAVDAHVAQHIYTNCIQGLLATKTRILCTHHVKFLIDADLVIVMGDDGRIKQVGPGRDIVPEYLKREDVHSMRSRAVYSARFSELRDLDTISCSPESNRLSRELIEKFNEQQDIKREKEEKEQGVINSSVYKFYCKSAGYILCAMVVLSLVLMQGSYILYLYFFFFIFFR